MVTHEGTVRSLNTASHSEESLQKLCGLQVECEAGAQHIGHLFIFCTMGKLNEARKPSPFWASYLKKEEDLM